MEIVQSYEGDGYRVVLAVVPAQGWFVEVHENDKCATECGPLSEKKANVIFAQASRANSYVRACVTVHRHKQRSPIEVKE